MNVYTFIYLNVLSIKSLSHHLNHFKKVKPFNTLALVKYYLWPFQSIWDPTKWMQFKNIHMSTRWAGQSIFTEVFGAWGLWFIRCERISWNVGWNILDFEHIPQNVKYFWKMEKEMLTFLCLTWLEVFLKNHFPQ